MFKILLGYIEHMEKIAGNEIHTHTHSLSLSLSLFHSPTQPMPLPHPKPVISSLCFIGMNIWII